MDPETRQGNELAFDEESKIEKAIEQFRADLELGYHVVPFVGAGFSAAAGIPLVHQLLNRDLPYWILRALSETRHGGPIWNVRSGIWPDGANDSVSYCASSIGKTANETKESEHELMSMMLERGSLLPSARKKISELFAFTDSKEPRQRALKRAEREERRAVLLEAREVLHGKPVLDWRRMIEFLARLKLDKDKDFQRLGPVADSVADSLFIHLSRHREPALSHRMLQALAPVLRFHVLLTTNFDTLIEQAFSVAGTALATFEVPRTARLPDASVVLAQTALVKLHGGRVGLRADASTDLPADREDIRNFLGYLAGYRGYGRKLSKAASREDRVALLCSGMSAQDRRTQSLLLAALAHFPSLRIYWLSYSEAKPPSIFEGLRKDTLTHLRHSNHGLFLLQLYQALKHTVPPSGTLFASQWQLPDPPMIPPPKTDTTVRKIFDKHLKLVSEKLQAEVKAQDEVKAQNRKALAVLAERRNRGGVTICSSLCQGKKFHSEHRTIWLDLDNIGRPVGVFVRLILTLGQQEGDHDPQCYLDTDAIDKDLVSIGETEEELPSSLKPVLTAFIRGFARSGKLVIVFLNGQETPGVDSPFRRPANDRANSGEPGWDNEKAVVGTLRCLALLNANAACGVQFVLLARESKWPDEQQPPPDKCRRILTESVHKVVHSADSSPVKWKGLSLKGHSSEFDPDAVAKEAIAWIRGIERNNHDMSDARRAFIRVLIMHRMSRYPAGLTRVMTTWCRLNAQPVGPQEISDRVHRWINELEKKLVVRRKPGGFIWMNSACKARIDQKLRDEGRKGESLALEIETTIELHIQMARWYGRLMLSSIDPLAAVEGVHHALETVRLSIELTKDYPHTYILPKLIQKAALQIEHARSLLCTARPLFQCRLSSQFAGRSLDILRRFTNHYLKNISRTERSLTKLKLALGRMQLDLWRDWSRLKLREGDYAWCDGSAVRFKEEVKELQLNRELASEAWRAHLCVKTDEASSHMYRRHYGEALQRFAECWAAMDGPTSLILKLGNIRRPPGPTRGGEAALEWLGKKERGADEHILMARLARRLLYLLLNRRQVVALASKLTSRSRAEAASTFCKNHLLWGLCFFDFGSAILRSVADTADGRVHEENVRLRAHAALCRGILEAVHPTNANDARNTGTLSTPLAETMLTDAEAFIEEFPMRDNGRNLGLAYLRRAELAIIRTGSTKWFHDQRIHLRCMNRTTGLRNPGSQEIVALVSSAHDALRWLDRAEEQLRQQPKIRWWWWILIGLKTKACEYLYVLQAIAQTSPSGKCGRFVPATVSRFMNSELLRLTEEKHLTDLLFLSRITYSYAQALLAKQYQGERLPAYQKNSNCSAKRVERVIKLRQKVLRQLVSKGGALCMNLKQHRRNLIEKRVLTYWNACKRSARQILNDQAERYKDTGHSDARSPGPCSGA